MSWTTSLEQVWRAPPVSMWLTLAAAAFFGVILLITLVRAEKSVANGALIVITLLAVVVAAATSLRAYNPQAEPREPAAATARAQPSAPALACVDDLAGEAVTSACEKVLFGSPDMAAAAVSYAAAQLTRLLALGDVPAANRAMTPEIQTLRRAIERDRYGLMGYVLTTRDRCTPTECAAFQSLTAQKQIAASMSEKTYDALVARYAPSWNAPSAPAMASLPLSNQPTGKPTNADFPSAASIPPISIMTAEPPPRAAAPSGQASPAKSPASGSAPSKGPPRKQAASKDRTSAPTALTPSPVTPSAAPAPPATTED